MEKKSFNILMIAHASNEAGGGEDDFFRLLKEFKGEFHIYGVIPDGYRAKLFSEYSDEFVNIPDQIFPFTKFNLPRYIWYLLKSVAKAGKLIPYLKKIRNEIDICFVNSSVCLTEIILLNHYKIPYVLSIKEKIEPHFIRKIIYRYYDRTAKSVIVISEQLRRAFEDEGSRIKPELIYSSIDEEEYSAIKNECSGNFKKDGNTFTILNVGNIYPLKNQMMLLDALSNYKGDKKIKVIFAGSIADNNYSGKIKAKAAELKGIEIIFAGALNRKELLKEMYLSDCVAITSKQEGMSLVLVESLFMEKPVIATPVGAIPDVIVNGVNGFILNGFDSRELSSYIRKLTDDRSLAEKISENAFRAYKENFNIEHYLKSHRRILLNNAKRNERS